MAGIRYNTFMRFNFPMLRVYWPFATGGLVTLYLIKKGADAQAMTDEFKSHPLNRLARLEAKHGH